MTKKHEEINLVVLQYAPNECCVQVVTLEEARRKPRFSIDLENGIWSYGKETFKIGNMRSRETGSRGGIIGVYDHTDIAHLGSMASASIKAVEHRHGSIFDD